jgi:calcineurin-like phosphoesterase family protein
MSKIFYISDTHFGHENVIKFDKRPFENVQEMNEGMMANWNSVVNKDDLVYILGDFMWKFKDEDFDFVKKLNGRKRLIKGNHDKCHGSNFKRLFEAINDYEVIKDGDRTVVMSHFPMVAYDGSFRGRNVHLFGHCHITKEYDFILDYIQRNKCEDYPMRMYNIGCMMEYMGYTPRTLDEILEKNEKK